MPSIAFLRLRLMNDIASVWIWGRTVLCHCEPLLCEPLLCETAAPECGKAIPTSSHDDVLRFGHHLYE